MPFIRLKSSKEVFFKSYDVEFNMKNHRKFEKLPVCVSFYLKNSAMRLNSTCFFV